MTRFVVVPQWQGSPSTRAMQLVDGAEQIAGDLPRAACTRVEVPLEAGESLGTQTRRLSSLQRTRERTADALSEISEPVVLVGGDASVALTGIAHAAAQHPRLAVVWFAAHASLHSPDTSPHGALGESALRTVFEDGDVPSCGVDRSAVILAGSREIDDDEHETFAALRTLSVDDLSNPQRVADAVAATGADAVWVHVSLDVLDPAAITGLATPVPFGLAPADLTAAIAAARKAATWAGGSLTGFAPASPAAAVDDLGTILRIVGALA